MNKLTYSILAGALFFSACAVGVDSSPDWANSDELGGNASASIIVIKANVSVPATTSASISKDLDLSKADVPASGYQAVCENFITGEICGTSTIASDGSAEIPGDEAKMADPYNPTNARFIIKAIPQGGSVTDEGVVEKYKESAITSDISEIDAAIVNTVETFSLQMIRAQLGIETSADTSGARTALSTGVFMPGCFQAFMSGTVASSVVAEANMSGALASTKAGFECIMSNSKPADFGFASFPEMFRATASGILPDSVIDGIGSKCSAVDVAKVKNARDAMSAVRQSAAVQIAGDAVTCTNVLTNANEMSAWKEAFKATDPAKLTSYETYKNGDGANLEKAIEVARSSGDFAAFVKGRVVVTLGAIGVEMDSDELKTMMNLVKTADLQNVSNYSDFGKVLANVTTTCKDNLTYWNALNSDPAKYSIYYANNSNATAQSFGLINNTFEMNSSSLEACKSQNGGVFTSSCFSGLSMPEISGILSVLSTTPAINGAIKAVFSKKVSPDTVNASTFTVRKTSDNSPIVGAVFVGYDERTVTFTSSNLAANTQYTATLTIGIKDLSGASMAANYPWTFIVPGAPGTLDASFGTGGKVTTAMSTAGADSAIGISVLSDGRIVAAGSVTNATNDFGIARYNSNGGLDTTFGTGGKVSTDFNGRFDWASALVIQPDGKYVVTGRAANATWDFGLMRYNTDGSLDSSCDTDGKVVTALSATADDQPIAAAIQSDGKILAGGWLAVGTTYVFALVRYNTDCSLDTTFDTDGIVTTSIGTQNDQVYCLAVQPDGKIVATGLTRNGTSTQLNFAVARYNTDGSLDTSFDSDGKATTNIEDATTDYANGCTLQPDGKIIAVGLAKSPSDFAVIRYNTNGSLDTSFGVGGIVTTNFNGNADIARAVRVQSDGKIVVAGSANNGTNDDFALVRYNSDGSLDTTFGTGGKVITAVGSGADVINRAMQIQSDGKIIVGGKSNNGTDDDFALARYWP